ncbi:MAG TPA: hypothetical protein VIH61_07050 [Waddliaceae bacterium]
MTTISLFTTINYTRPKSCGEEALSKLSNYFYLRGTQATVIKGNEVQLENGKVSWKMIALKVASYVLLFPITPILFAIYLILRTRYHFIVINPGKNPNEKPAQNLLTPIANLKSKVFINQSIELPAYAKAFYNDLSISAECKELFKFIFIDIINPNTIESIQPLEQLVEKKGKLTNKLREFNVIHFGEDTDNYLGCRGSAHSLNKSDPWQTIKITAPNISELGKTSPILLELKKNLDKHYHLKSGGGSNWNQWLNLSFEDKMKQNKHDPICFNQNRTIMTPQLMLTLIDLRKILGLIKSDKEYITALEQAYD